MPGPLVLIFHRPATDGDPPLVRILAEVRQELARRQALLFERAGEGEIRWITDRRPGRTFGEVLAELAPARGGVIVLGSGAVARLNGADARQLVNVAASGERQAMTNNRYSSDICAIGRARVLRDLPALPSDNALPRWLEERAGYSVVEIAGRDRLALDLDTPLDVALAALAPGAPSWLTSAAARNDLVVPRRDDLRRLAAAVHGELLVFGRSGSRTLAWLEHNVRCRVRFLAEERGLRASSPLAIGDSPPASQRAAVATLGLLLEQRGPSALAGIVAELADGAIIDTRVLLAHRFGADEGSWPADGDRFASDLHRPADVGDPWLREIARSAADADLPIVLGGHSVVGPGIPILLRRAAR